MGDSYFPEHWKFYRFEQCMEQIIDYRGKTPKKSDIGIPLVTAKNIKGGRILWDTSPEFLPEENYDAWMRRGLPEPGDIVMTMEAPLGEVAQLDYRKVALAQRIITIRGKKGFLENSFLKYLMQSHYFQWKLKSRATGTTVIGIKQSELRQIKIPIPPLPEQRRIAHILGKLDDKIELNRRMNHTLEAIARTIFKSWFVDFNPVRAKLDGRDTGLPPELNALFPDGLEDSELGKIPRGWVVGTLGQISEKPQYGYTASAQEDNVGPKFIRIKDINKTPWIEWGTVPYCEIENEDVSKYKVSFGDVLIARMADPGHGIMVEDDLEAVFASYLIRFKLKDRNFSRYVQFWLKSSAYWDIVHSRKTGTTRPSINAKDMSRFPLIIPPLKLVIHFGKVSSSLREQIVANVSENETLAELRDTLLPKLMRGELRVD